MPEAADASSSPERQLSSEIPLTEREDADIRDQIERNWNLGSFAGSPSLAGMMVEMRLALLPDGTVSRIEVMNDQPGNPAFQQAAESARRAVMIASPLKLPPGKTYDRLVLRFYPDQMVQ